MVETHFSEESADSIVRTEGNGANQKTKPYTKGKKNIFPKYKKTCPVNPLNAELNPICYLLALLGAHHFFHVSRIRVKSLTLRELMSYIYIYIYIYIWSTYS